ncbi:Rhs-family protein [Snodgrassella alvi wkB2]|uniref:RHS domain-containing protein n=1 Tax=Snodgrassella alvi TaxID=1196083 RepID=A0ABD7Z2R4_9NEIS|nr:RHS domain-containing protein [Snodgrassella alvi]AHN27505.1 Rhs-family protein [Snodgrassella alvi wkB2]PIT43049.1 hypothetical protein BHC45_11385 [Snodgrassella alvi]PIT67662.1 hypothetical protein BHC52_11385 [Snodgrassella alvi]UOO99299.1 RHS domain-containing protein [Snodgrassella alvi wkB2]WLS98836.1 RHS domain-containing protein [Snodgrassella alvi]
MHTSFQTTEPAGWQAKNTIVRDRAITATTNTDVPAVNRPPAVPSINHYDAEHRLTEVRIEQLNHTERYGYVYDALGRRIEKHRLDRDGKPCNRTTFLWDGLQMIQESSADKRQSLYLYTDEGSYEPLARIDRTGNQEQQIYYFHTDLNGMPEELTDEAGEIVWECSYQLWGKPVQEIAHR